MNNIFQSPILSNVRDLLIENQLPFEDLTDSNMVHFFGCGDIQNTKGIIGLEKYGEDGLLRSLAVSSQVRGLSCGSDLVGRLEIHAQSVGVKNLYLLTNTAEEYFHVKGFSRVAREMVSESIKLTKEFSGLCPESATVMCKKLPSL